MSELIDFILQHSERGACQCGQCADRVTDPAKDQPAGHTADLCLFQVSARNNPKAEELREIIQRHQGEFNDLNPFDGEEHSYIDVGGWIGDQGMAMQLMGLGLLLGLWQLLTPKTVLGLDTEPEWVMKMARAGLVTIKATS